MSTATLHLEKAEGIVADVCRAAFPDYTGRKVKVSYTDSPISITSYWDGGTKSYYAAVRLSDCAVVPVPSNGGLGDRSAYAPVEIPQGVVIVEHVWFCGKDMGLTVHARAHEMPILPPASDLSDIEAHVLIATASRKSSYAGESDYRASELKRRYGYGQAMVNAAREALRDRKYLNGANAITAAGRNAIEGHKDRWTF